MNVKLIDLQSGRYGVGCDACACPPVAFDFARWDARGGAAG